MKKNIILLITFIAIFFSTKGSFAATHFEPFAGMEFNSSAEDDSSEYKISGTSIGARLGFERLGFMAGLDGRRSSWNLDPDGSADDSDYTFTQLGFFLGYELPIKVRFWATYVFSLEGVDNDDSDNKLKEGSGSVVGFGLKFLGWLSANIEASNVKTAKAESALGESDSKTEYTAYTFSISFPLSL